ALDAWRRPERFREFLQACEADARGRTGLERQPYWQAGYWLGAFTASRVDVSTLTGQGLTGPAMTAAIRTERLTRISAYREQFRQEHSPS
ncbi:MAG: multifunctional CCA tRNA nucleotidyl transferase/2'3'-cyclic phosphodiesterase/2'nucleotidase/phosphatase, partial [Perlucidibaca sp.]